MIRLSYLVEFSERIHQCFSHYIAITALVIITYNQQEKHKGQVKNNVFNHPCQLDLLFGSSSHSVQFCPFNKLLRTVMNKVNISLAERPFITFFILGLAFAEGLCEKK